jgi:TonB family protein
MKICPKCARSFADGFKYCPRDATELVKYDLRAQIHARSEFQFLLKNRSLFARLRDEIADAMSEMKRNPLKYIISLLRGDGSSRRRRKLLQAGVATALITYSSIVLIVVLPDLLKTPMTGSVVGASPVKEPTDEFVRLVIPTVNDASAQVEKPGRDLLGGSLRQPKRSGGGGGANDKAPTSRGKMPIPSFSPQINLPDITQSTMTKPQLVVPETVYVDPAFLSRLKGPIGIPDGQLEAPSRGARGGTGIGNGEGPGYSSGKGGNIGGGPKGDGGGPISGIGDGGSIVMKGKPTILYKERARYTEEARRHLLQGTVVLSVVFGADGRLHDIRTVKGLPYGLTENAIEAAKKIRFQPAIRDGKPVSVHTVLEFNFALY